MTRQPLDSNAKGMLAGIRRGKVGTAGILADYLEEQGDPRGKALRELYKQWERAVRYWQNTTTLLRRWPKWQTVAYFSWWLRDRTGRLFRRRWGNLTYAQLYDAEPAHPPTPPNPHEDRP
jgi:hypothetical protein